MFDTFGLTCREIDVEGKKVGDIIKVYGKTYRVTKKTSTAIAVERWYWIDSLLAKLMSKDGAEE
jgi:hypothetical protein